MLRSFSTAQVTLHLAVAIEFDGVLGVPLPAGHPTASSLIEAHRIQRSHNLSVVTYCPATVCTYRVVPSCYLV